MGQWRFSQTKHTVGDGLDVNGKLGEAAAARGMVRMAVPGEVDAAHLILCR
jgi:hypothetical protein